jgi:hypothetical protein
MKKTSKSQTAVELAAQLQADPAFQAARLEREKRRLERVAELKAISKPLDDALRAVCPLVVDGVWDLVNTQKRYDEALPVLREHLTKDYPDEVLDGIARALAVPQALPYRPLLISLFRRDPAASKGFRYGLGVAIANTTGPHNLQETIELAKDRSLGESRLALLPAIRRSRKPEIQHVIDELSKDPDLAKEIASWKRRKK